MPRNKKPKIDNVSKYFDKKYSFAPQEDWKLPWDVYTSEKWYLDSLQIKKTELNQVKELLEKYDLNKWSKHTKSRDPSTAVLNKLRREYNLEFQTQAWCKFCEIINSFSLICPAVSSSRELKSLHLCEAPGAFVCSLNHYLASNFPAIKWTWTANALNPYYEGNSETEMISDDRFMRLTLANWNFGKDFTGDITAFNNHLSLVNNFVDDEIMLITADGSVDCMSDPGNQELHVAYLHYCEVITALQILSRGGNLVVKIFTMFEESTICILYLLNCVFKETHVFKPLTSKSGNSELYLICLNYFGKQMIENWNNYLIPYRLGSCNKSMFKLTDLPQSFQRQIHECADIFMKFQIEKIKDNIQHFGTYFTNNCLRKFNNIIADQFVTRYSISNIPIEKRISNCITKFENRSKNVRNDFYKIYHNPLQPKLDLAMGKKYTKVLYSKYSTNDNLRNFNFKRNNTKFYNVILSSLACNYSIINITQKEITDISKFNYSLLLEIRNCIESNSRDLLIIGPFATNVQAGILFLLTSAYDFSVFLNIGCVIFKNISNSNKNNILKQLECINSEYISLNDDSESNFETDLLQLINFNDIVQSGIFEIIVQHNDNFSKYWQLS